MIIKIITTWQGKLQGRGRLKPEW